MKKLLLCLGILIAPQYISASEIISGDSQKIQHNNSCHYCRISNARKRAKNIKYINCLTCKFSYCTYCIKKHELENFEKDNICLRCQDKCCCQAKVCKKKHKHCFTYKRTQKRHAEQLDLKWTKTKKEYNEEEVKKEKKSNKRKRDEESKECSPKYKKIKKEHISEESSFESESVEETDNSRGLDFSYSSESGDQKIIKQEIISLEDAIKTQNFGHRPGSFHNFFNQ